MAILGKGRGESIPRGEFSRMRGVVRKEFQREKQLGPKDTSIFRGKPFLKRGELRTELRKASPFIPGYGGRMLGAKERVGLEKEVFGKKYGLGITKQEYSRGIKELEKAKYKAPTQAQKFQIERQIRFLKGLGEK